MPPWSRSPLARLAPVLAVAGFAWLSPGLTPVVHACGGFWCSLDAPVEQTGERIVFVQQGDSTTAVIEIQYRGPSSKFAWLIPMPGKPEIRVSSTRAFDRLDEVTKPEYRLERTVEGTCKPEPDYGREQDAGASFSGDTDAGSDEPAGIMVVDRGTVGPYEYATISVDPSLDTPAQVALDWFRFNGYDLTGVDAEILGPYLADGLNLLAFKLTKAASQNAGTIRPVALTFEGGRPMIPIRPTAVAAQRDMGVLVWVVAEARAVPDNYKSLILNDALIDWFNPGATYRAVVTRAADEAGGQGFATELAGPGAQAAESVFTKADADRLRSIEQAPYEHGLDALWAANFLYRDWEGWRDAVADGVHLPDGVSLDAFGRDPDSYRERVQIDAKEFFAALHEHVIDPVVDTQRLLAAKPYLTRLFTTMSSDEMTSDPVFTFNDELPSLSNLHVAQQLIECNPNVGESQAPWRIVLPLGDVVRGAGRTWPLDATMVPASRIIEQLSNAGKGTVLMDNTKAIEAVLEDLPLPRPMGDGTSQPAKREQAVDDGCAVYSVGGLGARPDHAARWASVLGLLALAARARRRVPLAVRR
jgi:hypothetical protein